MCDVHVSCCVVDYIKTLKSTKTHIADPKPMNSIDRIAGQSEGTNDDAH